MPILPDHERRAKASGIILIMSLIFAFSCFTPIIGLVQTVSHTQEDDHSFHKATCQFIQAATSCLVISIVPMGDLFLEWINCCSLYNGLFSVFGVEQRKKRVQAAAFLDTSSVRMNLFERTMFVVGVVCLGGNQSFPAVYLSPLHSALGIGFSSISGVFTRTAIVSLLCRISPTWTPFRSYFFIILLGVFHVLFVSTQLFTHEKKLRQTVIFLLVGVSFVGTFLLLWTLYDMFIRRPTIRTNTTAAGEENGNTNTDINAHTSIETAEDLSERRFHNVVVTIHLFAAYFPGILQLIWDYFGSQWSTGTTTTPISTNLHF